MSISSPKPISLKELLTRRYEVPIYQRPYAWEGEQVAELWYDLTSNAPPYFLGTLLLKQTDKNDNFEVVDGQQRLATLLLLLRAAVLVIKPDDEQVSSDMQSKYINPKDPLEDVPLLTMTMSKKDADKFESILLGSEFVSKKKVPSWAKLEANLSFFQTKLEEVKKEKGLAGLKSLIQNNVLGLTMIDVQVESETDVYLFFETLNDRGMDLSIADLIKNRVCSVASQDGKSPDDAALSIDKISETIGTGRMRNFLLHYCLSKSDSHEPTPRKKLMDWYGKTIELERNKFLSKLEENSARYAEFVDPRRMAQPGAKREALRYLKALDATRCYPLLLQADVLLSQKEFVRLCNALEILTFRHSTISKKDAKRLESIYYNLTKDIGKGVKVDSILKRLKDEAELVSNESFELGFAEFQSTNHQIARYALLKIEEYLSPKASPLDWDGLTLEHILPEGSKWDGKEQFLERLGNHTLLSDPLNKESANKPFLEKITHYKKEKKVQLTIDLLKYPDFGTDQIIERQKELASQAAKIWSADNIK